MRPKSTKREISQRKWGFLIKKEIVFLDSKRIEGTLPEMLDGALSFVRAYMRTATRINLETGERTDSPQYPVTAVREAVLNALVHRDYSIHTEGMPIQLVMYEDRIEITNPGGLYGRLTVDQLGHVQGDTRNPSIVTAMETIGRTENRYFGIPTIRYAMERLSLPDPVFLDMHGSFRVTLYNRSAENVILDKADRRCKEEAVDEKNLVEFCRTPRSRSEIAAHIGIQSVQYALKHYLTTFLKIMY